MKKEIFLVLIAILCQSVPAQVTVNLNATQDAAIGFHDGSGTANNNYGTAIQNAAFWIPSANGWGYNGNRALIQFNLTQIPAGASIISAELSLYGIAPYGSLPGHTGTQNSAYLQRITQAWSESTVTWNNQPASTIQNQIILPGSNTPGQNYINLNVKPLVVDMINNQSTSYGFLLKLISEISTNALIFASRDHSNSQLHPTLKIVYSLCTSTLTAFAITPEICSGSVASFSFNASGNAGWYLSASSTSPFLTSPQFNTTLTAVASTVVTYFAGIPNCSSPKIPVSVTVHPLPLVKIAGTSSVCCGTAATFTATGAISYQWNVGGAGSAITFSTCIPSIISVKGIDVNGCYLITSKTLSVIPKPLLTVSNPTQMACAGGSSHYSAAGASSYTWTSSTGPFSNQNQVSIPAITTSSFLLTGSDLHNCTAIRTIWLFVNECLGIQDNFSNLLSLAAIRNGIRIKTTTNIPNGVLEIIDISGRNMQKISLGDIHAETEVNGLTDGFYFVTLKEGTTRLMSKRLIIN